MREIHPYTKLWFPALREKRWVSRHRGRGHKVCHFGHPEMDARCYWYCSCQARYWC